jgi:hypothetical protein
LALALNWKSINHKKENWASMNFRVETDYAEALELVKQAMPNTSMYASRIQLICEMLRERGIRMAKVYREANIVSQELAKLGRVQRRTEPQFQNYLQDIAEAIISNCNPVDI